MVTFDDGLHEGKYIYKLRVGNMILEGAEDDARLSYYNAHTDGATATLMLTRKVEDIIDIAVGLGIYGKVFESMLLPVSLFRQINKHNDGVVEQHLYFSTTYGKNFTLSKRKLPFRYELTADEHSEEYKGETIPALLEDNGKHIMESIEANMKK